MRVRIHLNLAPLAIIVSGMVHCNIVRAGVRQVCVWIKVRLIFTTAESQLTSVAIQIHAFTESIKASSLFAALATMLAVIWTSVL